MVSVAHKRIIILLAVFLLLFLFVRYLLFHGAILAPQPEYKRTPGMPVLVTVFYEALCGDSKHFIIKQLLPAFKQAAPLMEIQLVPYGKAQTFTNPDGTYRFDCQHGALECEANMYHACAIEAIESTKERLDVIACMIRDNRNPKEAMHKCARQYGIENTDLIQKCYTSDHGGELLKLNGDATHALRPPVTFIPTITLDGSQHRQPAILKDLLGEVCKIIGDTEKAKEYCIS
ncbi:gamma-interferon-inducible lysosomal thiol reductase [Anastrepha obliqua]|uniref:gamma-interferon-inducible lysosomal thiol reductase n=1 Tax=Anastrepha obliqua TaxID=95512 RepID=UPI002409DE18|nr:gamma-interferon-inducible lysosomal thiol reductase [Anastrepha obliqua]